jgi:hypothetical protein
MLGSVATGWNNQPAIDKVIRTLKGGSSGRAAAFLISAGFLALGIYTGNLWLSVPFGPAATRQAQPHVLVVTERLAGQQR